MKNNFFEALHQLATDRGIPREEVEEILESAILSGYKKEYGAVGNAQVIFDRENNLVSIVSDKLVVKNPRNEAQEISIEKALKIQDDIEIGDELRIEENPWDTFGRIATQTAKQVIIQKIKEAEKNIIFAEYSEKEGELINGYLQRGRSRENMFVDLGKTEGILLVREQSPIEHYKTGDRIKALILEVKKGTRGCEVILSRAHPKFIEKLFEMEIPEIYDGIVSIVNVVREPGLRTKVAVSSDRDDVDSVGACVGMKGVRIQSIVRELEGEKIDIIEFSDDRKIMAQNALTPAKIKEVVETSQGGVIAVVDSEQYRYAVGKSGHNVRLASRICGFDIDIKTEESYQEFLESSDSRALVEQLFSTETDETPLEELPDLEPRVISMLEKGGVFSVEDLVELDFDDLVKIEGIGDKTAQKILEILADAVEFEDEDLEEDYPEEDDE